MQEGAALVELLQFPIPAETQLHGWLMTSFLSQVKNRAPVYIALKASAADSMIAQGKWATRSPLERHLHHVRARVANARPKMTRCESAISACSHLFSSRPNYAGAS